MLKLFKYLKNSIFSILLIILFLIIQAICDLSLPDYTSRIVNVGIQQSGIENAAYKALTSDTMDKLLLLVSEDDRKFILDNYTLISHEDSNKYSYLENGNIYELKKVSNKTKDKISTILTNPTYIVSTILSRENSDETFNMLSKLDENGINEFINNMKINEMPSSIISGSVPVFIKNEYKTVGINTNSIQTNYIIISGIKMLGVALFSMFTTIVVGLFGARLSARLGKKVRGEVFKKVVSFSKTEIKGFGTSSLITRTTNDVQQVQMVLVMLLRVVFYAPIVGVGGVIKRDRKSVV